MAQQTTDSTTAEVTAAAAAAATNRNSPSPINGCVGHRHRTGRVNTAAESPVRRRILSESDAASATVEQKTTDEAAENVLSPVPTTTISKIGDVDREREIERRLAELGLTEYKKRHERRVLEALDAQITAKDELAAVLRRCRRRHRQPSSSTVGNGVRPVDEIRNLVQQKIIRDAWGEKVAYEIRIIMGCFTKDVSFEAIGHVIDVQGETANGEDNSGVKLTKNITVELPQCADETSVIVTYTGGVVKIYAPVGRPWRPQTTLNRPTDEQRPKSEFLSISPIYSLQRKLTSNGTGNTTGSVENT